MEQIVLFGAGKSATTLIDYLIEQASIYDWKITVIDSNPDIAKSKLKNSPTAESVSFDIHLTDKRKKYIQDSSLVISLLPPSLHYLITEDCIEFGKNLLTASYADSKILNLNKKISEKNILFLCEMGLDPGIDHMSAMQLIHKVQEEGGTITSFKSYCGGLVSPESDDNPWHYKISWNPRNVVLAGKGGASFKENGELRQIEYEELFNNRRLVEIPGYGEMGWYPNRDSLGYMQIYGLNTANTFIRSTLRHPDYLYGWKNVVELKLTDETSEYETNNLSLSAFFKLHFQKHGFADWLHQKLMDRFSQTKEMLEKLMELMEAEEQVEETGEELPSNLMMVDVKGKLEDIHIDTVKDNAAALVARRMHEANLTLKQFFFLGMDDELTMINKGKWSAADVFQFALEQKLMLKPEDRDMVVMMHEITYEQLGEINQIRSVFATEGDDGLHTAMAKTVGLPLGIAAKLILSGKINLKGLHLPIIREIYEPVMKELATKGIVFKEFKS